MAGRGRIRRLLAATVVLIGTAGALCGPPGALGLLEPAAAEDAAPASTMPVPVDGLGRLQTQLRLDAVTVDQRTRAGQALDAAEAAALSARQETEAAAAAAAEAEVRAAAAQRTAASSPGSAPPTAAPADAGQDAVLPLGISPRGDQVITVVAPSSRSSTATLTAWQRGPQGWTSVVGPVPALVGSAGVGRASETTSRTPAGTFGLTEAFGRLGDPGTALPYRVLDPLDWWVSDAASPLYNQHTRCAAGSCPFDEAAGENLWAAGGAYDLAVVIDYNRGGAAGAGSAFFLHVNDGAPTAGCVAIGAGALTEVLRWLDPGAAPVIAIGVA